METDSCSAEMEAEVRVDTEAVGSGEKGNVFLFTVGAEVIS